MGLFRKLKDAKAAKDGRALDEGAVEGEVPQPQDLTQLSDPITLIVGSLEGCSKKDALAYAKGLAENHIVASNVAYVGVTEDAGHNRFIYEVHEGGPGKSLFEPLMQALHERGKVRLALTNGRSVLIEDHYGEIYSLISAREEPSDEPEDEDTPKLFDNHSQDVPLEHVWQYQSKQKLTKLYNEGEKLPLISGLILSVAFFAFVASGAIYTLVQGGAFEADAELVPVKDGHLAAGEDNPAWQLDRARGVAEQEGRPIHVLKKDGKDWAWEIQK